MVRNYMKSLGYTDKQINKILKEKSLSDYREQSLCNKIKDIYDLLLLFGFNQKDIIKITSSFPIILCYTTDVINNKIKELIALGYSHEDVIKMLKSYPHLCSLSINNIKNRINEMVKLGYSRDEVLRMTRSFSMIFGCSIDNITNKIDSIMKLGYSKEKVIMMTKIFPQIFSLKLEKIEKRINDMIELGYSRDKVLMMIGEFPVLLGYTIDGIREKKEFYDSIGLGDILYVVPRYIMQSANLSYVRYMYYNSIGIDINMKNYLLLFISRKKFLSKTGVSNEELLVQYDYQKYKEEKGISRKKKV